MIFQQVPTTLSICLFYHILISSFHLSSSGVLVVGEDGCLDHKGVLVVHGDRYFPLGSDPCTQCTCQGGKPEMCISVFCSPPENCRQFHALNDKCCEFVCLDRELPGKPLHENNSSSSDKDDSDSMNATNLGLRLVASTVTSFLILALLLFMVHRLHQRRLLLMIRRFHARRIDTTEPHLSRRFSLDDEGNVGYLVGGDHIDFSLCSDPPPPYTFWKPADHYIPPGEAPPPYEVSVNLPAYEISVVEPPQRAELPITVSSTPMVGLTEISTCVPLRSDARYEEVAPVPMITDADIERLATALCEEDLANGNVVLPTLASRYTENSVLAAQIKRPVYRKGKIKCCHHKRHSSFNEASPKDWHGATPREGGPRTSLQPPLDPTDWNNTESSSSSSPSLEPSPTTSSDSSSFDIDFTPPGTSASSYAAPPLEEVQQLENHYKIVQKPPPPPPPSGHHKRRRRKASPSSALSSTQEQTPHHHSQEPSSSSTKMTQGEEGSSIRPTSLTIPQLLRLPSCPGISYSNPPTSTSTGPSSALTTCSHEIHPIQSSTPADGVLSSSDDDPSSLHNSYRQDDEDSWEASSHL